MISQPKTLDDVLKRVLNDPDIFGPPFDRNQRSYIPLLFSNDSWKELNVLFEKKDRAAFNSLVDKQLQYLRNEAYRSQGWRKKQIEKSLPLGESLKKAFETKPNSLSQLFNVFDSFGLIECKLPNMEDFGKIIENHTKATIEQFFLYKIEKAPWDQKRALKKVFEYLKELYAMNLDVLEIAFFVRKLNSLTEFVEVIRDE
jgi:hypothetical protein